MGQTGGIHPRGYPLLSPGIVVTQGNPRPSEINMDDWKPCSVCDGATFVDSAGKPAYTDATRADVCGPCRGTGWERKA